MFLDRDSWFILITLLALGGIVWGMRDTRRIIEAPMLYSIGLLIIVLPQIYITIANPWRVPDEAFQTFAIMVILCTVALFAGYLTAGRSQTQTPRTYEVNDKALFRIAFAVSAAGAFGSWQLMQLGQVTEWRGWPVYWATLSRLNLAGISLLLFCYVRSGRKLQLLLAIVMCIFPAQEVLQSGRRSASLLLPITLIAPFVLAGRLKIPRWSIVLGLVAAFVIVYAFPYWRDRFGQDAYLDIVSDVPLSEIVANLFAPDNRKVLEVVDAMLLVGAYDLTGRFGYGLFSIYNNLIELYVPGSLIGHDLKNSLRLGPGISYDWVNEIYPTGVAFYTSKTGYSDLFGEFYYFGSFVVFLIGRLFGNVAKLAQPDGNPRAILFLCLFLSLPGTIPYAPVFFYVSIQLPQLLIFLTIAYYCIRETGAGIPGAAKLSPATANSAYA